MTTARIMAAAALASIAGPSSSEGTRTPHLLSPFRAARVQPHGKRAGAFLRSASGRPPLSKGLPRAPAGLVAATDNVLERGRSRRNRAAGRGRQRRRWGTNPRGANGRMNLGTDRNIVLPKHFRDGGVDRRFTTSAGRGRNVVGGSGREARGFFRAQHHAAELRTTS